MANRSALILGATGATGRHVLTELLASSEYSQVTEIGRRVTSFPQDSSLPGREKLTQKVVDFEKIDQEGLSDGGYDAVFIT
jgi:oxidoreductase